MRTKRNSVFETNSSSVNTMSLFRKEEWERFKRGELVMKVKQIPDPNFPGETLPKLYLSDDLESGGRDYETMKDCIIEELDGVVGICHDEYNF